MSVAIELQIGADPIEGSFRVPPALPRQFRGWLELTSLLHAAAGPEHARAAEAESPGMTDF